MITLPIKVGYGTVTVQPMSARVAQGRDAWGLYSMLQQTITLREDLTPAEQARVLVHELIHACFHLHDLDDTKLTEERVCEVLDGPLVALLTDNPWLGGVLHQAVTNNQTIV